MTTTADWKFREGFLLEQASYLEKKADELRDEAQRYRGLAEQAGIMSRCATGTAPYDASDSVSFTSTWKPWY